MFGRICSLIYIFQFLQKTVTESDEEVSDTNCDTVGACIALKNNSGYITRWNRLKIIRYTRFNIESEEKNYFREQLMLFTPWRDEEKELLNVDPNTKFVECKECIFANRAKFIYNDGDCDADIIERAIRSHEELEQDSEDDEITHPTEFEV